MLQQTLYKRNTDTAVLPNEQSGSKTNHSDEEITSDDNEARDNNEDKTNVVAGGDENDLLKLPKKRKQSMVMIFRTNAL